MNLQLTPLIQTLLAILVYATIPVMAQVKNTSTLEEHLSLLSALLEKSREAINKRDGESSDVAKVQMGNRLQAIKLAISQKNWSSLDSSLLLLESLSSNDPEILKLSREAREQIASRLKENKIRLKVYGEQILAAKTPLELDGIIQWLAGNPQAANPGISYGRQSSPLQFATLWQDYLAQNMRGDERSAQNTMKTLLSSFPANRFGIPRSTILTKAYPPVVKTTIAPEASTREVLAKVSDFDDIAKVLDELRQLEGQGQSISEPNLKSELERILSNYKQYQAGISFEVNFKNTYFDVYLLPLRLKLARLALPRALGLEGKMDPTKDETLTHYLSRVIEKGLEDGNSDLVREAYLAQAKIRSPYDTTNIKRSPEYLAIVAYQSAENYRAAEQYDQAVASYYTSLSSGSTLVPIQKIKTALEDIRKTHPAHFAAGVTISLNSYYRGYSRVVLPVQLKSVSTKGTSTPIKKPPPSPPTGKEPKKAESKKNAPPQPVESSKKASDKKE